jgi:hypothetical protein
VVDFQLEVFGQSRKEGKVGFGDLVRDSGVD